MEEEQNIINKKPSLSNKYKILVDIQGIIIDDSDGTIIEYREVSDYMNRNFPARILTMNIQAKQFAKIMTLEKQSVNGFGELLSVRILNTPMSYEGILNKPFLDGEFKGLLKTNDSNYNFNSVIDENSQFYKRGGDLDPRIKISIILFREIELRFSISNDVNALYPNPKLSDVFINSLIKSNPGLKLVSSNFDHDPNLGLFLLRHMSFLDVIDLLELEVGFYKTDYLIFIEFGVLFFLNLSDNINVISKELERNLLLQVGRMEEMRFNKNITKLDDYNYMIGVSQSDVRVYKDTENTIRDSYSFITPSGKKIDYINALTRDITTIRKITEAIPIRKLENMQFEYLDVTISDNSIDFLNPISKLIYLDSFNTRRNYRLLKKEIVVKSSKSSLMKLTGFRNL